MSDIKNKHAMIDIESMGLTPGCPVLTIGLVWFDPENNGWSPAYEGFYAKLDFLEVVENYKEGLTAGTLQWWLGQSDEARAELTTSEGAMGVKEGLQALASHIHDTSEQSNLRDVYVWGNSNKFDLGLLEFMFDKEGIEVPWNYARDMNCRTIVWLAKVLLGLKRPDMLAGTAHNALDDARHQARYVTQMVQALAEYMPQAEVAYDNHDDGRIGGPVVDSGCDARGTGDC